MIEIILGFAIGYGLPMFLLKRFVARHRRRVAAASAGAPPAEVRRSDIAA